LSRYVVEVLKSKGKASLRDLAKELNIHHSLLDCSRSSVLSQ